MNLAETFLGEKVLQQGIKLLLNDSGKNLGTLVNWARKVARDPHHKNVLDNIAMHLRDDNSNWYHLAQRLLSHTHPRVKERMGINFILNATLLGVPRQKEMAEKLGIGVPWAVLMDPTEKCNLHCTGCWAGDYQTAQNLDLATMDRICKQAEELGIYFIVLSGGEPLVRRKDLLRLAENHPNQVFHAFTNGTMVTLRLVEEMVRLGNVTLAFSLEGFEATTDARRGPGVFQRVMRSMAMLQEAGLLFGFSTTYTRQNVAEVGSDAFVDLMVEQGACYGWYFTYIPVGKDVDLDYMATPEQRAYIFQRIEHFRATRPILLVDFWNDGEASGGCIAGGRRYFHINAAGDVEPCAFVHYAACNIKDLSLAEALQNPLFRAYQERQPFSQNLRRPCPIIDNPEMLQEIVHEAGAHPTQLDQAESVDQFAGKIRGYSEEWRQVADRLWQAKHQAEKNPTE